MDDPRPWRSTNRRLRNPMIASVLIAESAPVIAPALASVECRDHVGRIVACASAHEVLEALDTLEVDIALIDARLEGGGVDLVSQITRRHPSLPVAVSAARESIPELLEVVRSGGRGYLSRRVMVRRLPGLVTELATGAVAFRTRHIARLVDELIGRGPSGSLGELARLNARESEILRMVSDGEATANIGRVLGVSELGARRAIVAALQRHDAIDRVQIEQLQYELGE
jgi:DNA-binding NarL/FixJ family response regulator